MSEITPIKRDLYETDEKYNARFTAALQEMQTGIKEATNLRELIDAVRQAADQFPDKYYPGTDFTFIQVSRIINDLDQGLANGMKSGASKEQLGEIVNTAMRMFDLPSVGIHELARRIEELGLQGYTPQPELEEVSEAT